jgi:AcrR family transcriptional regulator
VSNKAFRRNEITNVTKQKTDEAPRNARKYGGKDALARQQERKAKLLAAGIKLIGREGFTATSIDAICAEAGLTKRYFYESYESTNVLLLEAYQAVIIEFLVSIQQAAHPYLNDAKALVHAGLLQTFTFVANNPDKARLIMIEAMSVRGQLGHLYGKGYGNFVDLLVAFTKPFLKGEGTSDVMLTVMAKAMVGSLIHLCQGWIATDFKQPTDELVQGMEIIFAGMAKELGITMY